LREGLVHKFANGRLRRRLQQFRNWCKPNPNFLWIFVTALAAPADSSFWARNHRLRLSGLRDILMRLRLARMSSLRGLLVHPFVQPRPLKTPAIAKLERGYETVRSIFVKCVGTYAEIVRSHTNIHDFANLIPRRCCSHRSSLLWELQDRARVHTRRCAYTAFSPCNTRNYRLLL